MIGNLQDELYQLENNEKKVLNLVLTSDGSWRAKNAHIFFKVHGRQNMQNQAISELYNDDKKSKYSSNPKDIFRYSKKVYENFYTKVATTEFLSTIPNRKKISNEQFNLCKAKISLDEIIKSINSQTNNRSPGNDGLTVEFYKRFSNDLITSSCSSRCL